MRVLRFIPHKCWYKITGNNGLNGSPCEKRCRLCSKYIHLPWEVFLKENAQWKDGKFPWRNK